MMRELPKFLENYKRLDFLIREKARFIFYLCIAIIIATLTLIFFQLIKLPLKNINDLTQVTVLLSLTIMLFLIFGCLWLLIKGFYDLSSHLIPTIVMITIWTIMFLEKGSMLARMITVVNLFIAFSMIPLLLSKFKYSIILYSGVNILLLFIFVFFIKDEYNLTRAEISGYITDVSISLFFTGFIGYHIYAINKKAIERAENDLKKRIKVEKDFSQSIKRYQELTDLLPIAIFESDINGNILYTNQAGYKSFGYTENDYKKGINIANLAVEKELISTNVFKLIKGERTGHQYTAIKKNGEKFPVQIFSSTIEDEGKVVGIRGVIFDISERVKAEEAVRASEQKFREMTLLLPQTIYEADKEGKLTFINQAGTTMFGYTDDDIENGVKVFDVIAKEDQERAAENIKNISTGIITHGNQYTGRRKDGSTFPMQIHSSPIIENGQSRGFRGVVFDLTEIKKVENELRQSNELFKTLIESSPVSISLSDMDHRFLMVNKAFCNDLGLKAEDVFGKTPLEIGLKTDDKKADIIRNILKEKGYIENFETTVIDKNGKKYDIYIYAAIVTINNQKALLRLNVNVTEKKHLENKLRESENLFRTIVNMVPYSITITNSENKYTFANRAFQEKFNFSLKDIVGKTINDLDLKVDEKSLKQYQNEFREKGSVYNLEYILSGPDKKKNYALLSSQSVLLDNKPHVIKTSVDITDRKILEEQLKDYNLKLEELVRKRTEELEIINEELITTNDELSDKNEIINNKNKELNEAIELIKSTQLQLIQTEKMASLGTLTAGVAHEVNNPLNYLMGVYVGFENYFQEHGTDEPKKIGILLNSMNVGIERISKIVKGLNQFSRDVDTLEEDCDIHIILDNCITMLYNKLKHKVELTKKYSAYPVILKGNVGRLHQVFVNIISNAIEAIPKKGTITIVSEIKGEKAIIEIIDDGVGIEKKYLSKITDPFFTTKAPGEGTGLGLSITQSIIKEHKGEMKFESEINKGTKVLLSFPII